MVPVIDRCPIQGVFLPWIGPKGWSQVHHNPEQGTVIENVQNDKTDWNPSRHITSVIGTANHNKCNISYLGADKGAEGLHDKVFGQPCWIEHDHQRPGNHGPWTTEQTGRESCSWSATCTREIPMQELLLEDFLCMLNLHVYQGSKSPNVMLNT